MDFDAGFDARFGGTGVGFGEHDAALLRTVDDHGSLDAAADALARVALAIGTRLVALVPREPTLAPGDEVVASFAATATRAVPESEDVPADERTAGRWCGGVVQSAVDVSGITPTAASRNRGAAGR